LICAQYKRGSVIYGLWYDGVNWHKTIQGDEDQYGIVRLAQQKLGGKLQKETRWFAGGMNGDSVTVRGRMTMTNGKSVQYQYELEFMPKFFVSTRLSPAGFELGMIAGKDYKLL
jgi:hypothetical protein